MAPTTQSRGIKYCLAAPHAMRQSTTVSNMACDKDTKGRCSKDPPHLSNSKHPVKGRSVRQYPRTHRIWRQKAARCQIPRGSHFFPVTLPRMNANAVPCGLSTPSRQRCGHMATAQCGWRSDPVVAAKQYRK
ncbi:hypothetical protein TcCL_Unassigned01919 [Trypanosoma cruzi]|nr:hypothetical protein TcCL_Unassigned01919 [Trypanosoma cruzi]